MRIAKLKLTVKICIEIVKKSFRDAIKPGIDKIMSNTIARITYRTCWEIIIDHSNTLEINK